MTAQTPPRQYLFDPTPEIHATDSSGNFNFVLGAGGERYLETRLFDEARFVVSIWYPGKGTLDLDRCYVEMRCCFNQEEEHWTRIAEIEPVVPPYAGGDTFDGWIVLPILGASTSFAVAGSGFEARTRVQIRASAYMVA